MKKVLVTGGSGKLGRAVLRDLVEHGYAVLNVDQQPLTEPICPSVRVDLSNFGEVASAILGGVDERGGPFDAVVHLAAIPAPGLAANARTLSNNVSASYNVFEACRLAGIKNVVFASSETVLGLPFDTPPPYAPVDEEYFPRPESAYSLGKLLDETMAAQFCRWDPDLRMVGLRFSNVMYPEDYKALSCCPEKAQVPKMHVCEAKTACAGSGPNLACATSPRCASCIAANNPACAWPSRWREGCCWCRYCPYARRPETLRQAGTCWSGTSPNPHWQ